MEDDLGIFAIEPKNIIGDPLVDGSISFRRQVKFVSDIYHFKNLAMEDISRPLTPYCDIDAINMAPKNLIRVGSQVSVIMSTPVKAYAPIGLAPRSRRMTISKNVVIG